jgi:hypothetical protein
MGIEPHFNLWNYFFHVWLRSDPAAEAVMLGCVGVHVHPGQGTDPYFRLSVFNSPVGRRRGWFFLRNNTTAPFLEVTGRRPTPQSCWGYGVAKKDLRKLQPMSTIFSV